MLETFQATTTNLSVDWNNTGTDVGQIDSIDSTKKRRTPRGQVRHLDDEIPDRKRRYAVLSARQLQRNFEIGAWAIRKHLDFVSSFSFKMRTKNKKFNRDVESFVEWWSRSLNFDASGRFSLAKSIRIHEALRCVDGDSFLMKLSDGRIQSLEGDRVKTPSQHETDVDLDRVYNGVEIAPTGRPLRYAVHARTRPSGLKFDRWVRSRNIFTHGFFERFDQVRGVSPILASLGRFQDVYEGFDYALQRAKVAQLFGLVLQRNEEETGFGPVDSEDGDGDGTNDRHSVKLGSRPFVLDMEPGESAEFLENKTPAPEFQNFSTMMIAAALKSLDIPFSFYDESFTNFFGSKAALVLYLLSARAKRAEVQELLRQLTIWRLRLAIDDGDIVPPRSIQTFDDIRFVWNPTGIPWFDPRDVRGDIDAIKAGLKTRTQVRLERYGDDWSTDVAPELAAEEQLIDSLGLNVTMESGPTDGPVPDDPEPVGNETDDEDSDNA